MNGVAMWGMGAKLGRFSIEFRSGSNGIGPGPQTNTKKQKSTNIYINKFPIFRPGGPILFTMVGNSFPQITSFFLVNLENGSGRFFLYSSRRIVNLTNFGLGRILDIFWSGADLFSNPGPESENSDRDIHFAPSGAPNYLEKSCKNRLAVAPGVRRNAQAILAALFQVIWGPTRGKMYISVWIFRFRARIWK